MNKPLEQVISDLENADQQTRKGRVVLETAIDVVDAIKKNAKMVALEALIKAKRNELLNLVTEHRNVANCAMVIASHYKTRLLDKNEYVATGDVPAQYLKQPELNTAVVREQYQNGFGHQMPFVTVNEKTAEVGSVRKERMTEKVKENRLEKAGVVL